MMSCCLVLVIFGLITAPSLADECSVLPTTIVVTVGQRVDLTCTAHGDGIITSWTLMILKTREEPIYTAASHNSDNTSTPENVTNGYSVTHHADNETSLHMNKTILSQAGSYTCICNNKDRAVTTVVILDSEPKFTTDHSGENGEPVTFSCSVSFNASSYVSCELRIEDASGSTVARKNGSTLNNGLIGCDLNYTVIANESDVQWHTCNVSVNLRLSTQDGGGVIIIDSRVLNTTVTVERRREPQEERGKETSHKLAIGLSVSIVAVIVVIAVVVVYIIQRRWSNGSNPPRDPIDLENIAGKVCSSATQDAV